MQAPPPSPEFECGALCSVLSLVEVSSTSPFIAGKSVFSPPPPTPPPSSITPFLAPFPAQNLLLKCRTDEPFLSQRAHSNTHLAISLTSSERSGEVKRSPVPFIQCDTFAVQIWREISVQNLPPSSLPGPFVSIFHCQIESNGRGIILGASDLIVNLSRWPRTASIVALFILLFPHSLFL